jgi:hypothetical protein
MYLLNLAQAHDDFIGSGPQIRHTELIQKSSKKIQDLRVESLNVTYLREKIMMYASALNFLVVIVQITAVLVVYQWTFISLCV